MSHLLKTHPVFQKTKVFSINIYAGHNTVYEKFKYLRLRDKLSARLFVSLTNRAFFSHSIKIEWSTPRFYYSHVKEKKWSTLFPKDVFFQIISVLLRPLPLSRWWLPPLVHPQGGGLQRGRRCGSGENIPGLPEAMRGRWEVMHKALSFTLQTWKYTCRNVIQGYLLRRYIHDLLSSLYIRLAQICKNPLALE